MRKFTYLAAVVGIFCFSLTSFSEEIVCKETIEKYKTSLSQGEIKVINDETTVRFITKKFKTKEYKPETLNFIKECLKEAISEIKTCENPKFSGLDVKEKKTFFSSKFYVQTQVQCSNNVEMAKN